VFVTLRGDVRNKKDRQKLHEQISALPGLCGSMTKWNSETHWRPCPAETKSY
jgi:hypothetical protein